MKTLLQETSKPIDRRTFLKRTGLGLLGATLPLGFTGCSQTATETRLPGLSMQLYTELHGTFMEHCAGLRISGLHMWKPHSGRMGSLTERVLGI